MTQALRLLSTWKYLGNLGIFLFTFHSSGFWLEKVTQNSAPPWSFSAPTKGH